MSNTLYEYAAEYRSVVQRMIESSTEDGEVEIEVMQELDEAQDALEVKAQNCAQMYLELLAEAAKLKDFEKKVQWRRNVLERRAECMKEYIDHNLQAAGVEKISGDLVNISYRTSERVVVDNVAEIPEDCLRVKIEVDKTAIKEKLKAGATMGAHLEKGKNIQIK